jgi:hypothetical protein
VILMAEEIIDKYNKEMEAYYKLVRPQESR